MLLLLPGALQDQKTGTIEGRVSPEVPVKLVLKKEQMDAAKPENVKAELLLPKGGDFKLENIPPGRYDLMFLVQGDDSKKWIARYWGDLNVEAGKTIEGIHYRLTPGDARFMIDEVLVSLKPGSTEAELRKAVKDLRCRIKQRPPFPEKGGVFSVDIPDEKSVEEMLPLFQALPCVQLASKNGISRVQ